MKGWLNVNKDHGLTSFDVIRKIKKILNVKKIGHAGTLDPFAVGVLPIAIGSSTRLIEYVTDKSKSYKFTIEFGKETDTIDLEGKIINTSDKIPTKEDCLSVCTLFLGEIDQMPPAYSAIKIDGQRAYDLARKGIDFEIKSRKINIHSLDFLDFDEKNNRATYRVLCSKGTYVRSLARDISYAVQTVGFVVELIRESVGSLSLKDSVKIEDLSSADILSTEKILDDIPVFEVDFGLAQMVLRGQKIDASDFLVLTVFSDSDFVMLKNLGEIISIGKIESGFYIPSKNFG